MKENLTINNNSLIKSGLLINDYIFLQILYEKNEKLLNNNIILLDWIDSLIREEYIKFTGDALNLINENNIDIDDFILLPKTLELFNTDDLSKKVYKLNNWIEEYRNLFKGIKIGSKGDKNACLLKMKRFIKENPKYTKEDIFKATKFYIDTTEPIFTSQADYFIYKTGNDKIVSSKLGMYCEMEDVKIKKPMQINKMI